MKKNQITNIAVSPVIYKDKFLLIKRTKTPYENLWCMPGGKVEMGEHPQEAILREIFEEAALKIDFITVRGVVSEILRKDNRIEGQFVVWVCETKSKTEHIKESDEGKVAWFTKAEIISQKKNIIPSDFEMIKTFFFKKKQNLSLYKSHMHFRGETYQLEYFDSK